MTRCRPIVLLATVLLLGATSPPDAHAQAAAVEGVARAADGSVPVAFALVRLLPADSTAASRGVPPQGITSADGRYRFGSVPAGRYRVQLLRIGFRPVLSDPVQVVAGQTVQLPLRVVSEPLTLPPVTVTPDACVTARELAGQPRLQALWQQARDGASVRLGLMARFRYHMLVREESAELKADGPSPVSTLDQPLISDPRYAFRNAERRRSQRLARGYYAPNDGWSLPDELDVLHEDFLNAHCLLPTVERGEGELGLRFQPLRTHPDFLDVRGTIWLDSATYLARRIELEYVDGDDSRGTVRLDFGDVAVAGGVLRMPTGGVFAMRSSRRNPAKRAEGKLTFRYSDFEEVLPH